MLASWSLTVGMTFWGSLGGEFDVVRDPSTPAPQEKTRVTDVLALIGSALSMLGGLPVLITFAAIDMPPGHTEEVGAGIAPAVVNMSLASAIFAVVAALCGMLLRRVMDRDVLHAIATLLDAHPLSSASRLGTRVRLTGVVRDPTPVASPTGPAAFAITSDEEHVPGSDPNIERGNLASDRTFYIVGSDAAVELDARGVLWTPGDRRQWRTRAPSGNDRTITVDYLPVGAPVLVAGTLHAGAPGAPPSLRVTPTTPVVLMRHGPDEDPFAVLRGVRRRSRLALLVLALHVLVTTAIGVALTRDLPPWHSTSSGGTAE